MAIVPRYTQQLSVKPIPAPTYASGAHAGQFGAQFAQQLGAVGQGADRLGKSFLAQERASQDKVAKAAVRDRVNRARNDMREYTSGVYKRQGEGATNVYSEANTDLNKMRDNYIEEFENENQRAMFSASFDPLMNGHLDRVHSFQEKSRYEYESETLDAENLQAVDDAIAARTDPNEIENSERTIVSNTKYKYRGMDKAVVDRQVDLALDNMHSKIISSKVNDSPKDALEYFDKNKDKINPGLRSALKKKLEVLTASETAFNMIHEGLLKGRPEEDMRSDINKVKDDSARRAARSELDYRLAVKSRREREKQETNLNEIWTRLDKSNDASTIPNDIAFPEQIKMRNYLSNKMKGSFNPNIALYEQLRDEAYTDSEKFLSRNISESFSELGQGYTNDLIKLKSKLRAKGSSKASDEYVVRGQSYNAFQNDFVRSLGFDLKDSEETANAARLRQMFDSEVNNYPGEQRDSMETWNKVRDMLTMEVEEPGFLWNSDFRLYEAELAGKEYTPKETPKGLPKDSTWVNTSIGGSQVKGWSYQNQYGTSFVYGADGTMYRWDIPQSIVDADSDKPVGRLEAIGRWQ